jgi:CRISPR/Cas system-associated protein Csm6
MKVIITTVGTSLLTNLIKKETVEAFKFDLDGEREDISKGKLNEEFSGLETYCESLMQEELDNALFNFSDQYKVNLNASAEIKSICAIANGQPAKVYLLCTDTFMSEYCGQQMKNALDGQNKLTFIGKPLRIEKLNLEDADAFQNAGFEYLIGKIDEIYSEEGLDEIRKRNKIEIILNISGGYKALIPFLTIYAQIKNLPISYIYESSDTLINIPPLPISFDWAIIEGVRPYLKLGKIDLNNFGKKQQVVIRELAKDFFIREIEKNKFTITTLGKLLVEEFHSSNIRNNVLGSFIEYKYFEYFIRNGYETTIGNKKYELPYSYIYNADDQILKVNFEDLNKYNLSANSGDIDLIITEDGVVSLIEAKNYSTALSYGEKIEKYRPKVKKANEEDYYRQIKSKIEAYLFTEKKLPQKFIFLVNLILFEGDDKNYSIDDELLKVLNHFQIKLTADYSDKIIFIPKICTFNYIKEGKLKVNYDKLLKDVIKDSDFKLIKLNNHV